MSSNGKPDTARQKYRLETWPVSPGRPVGMRVGERQREERDSEERSGVIIS